MSVTTIEPSAPASNGAFLRRLYGARFVVAIAWAVVLLATDPTGAPLLTVLVVIYPLVDAGSVYWQIRADRDAARARASEWVNVGVSVLIAVTLGIASAVSVSATVAVWGVWAIISGVPQLLTAIARRSSGGQVPQILSGAISVLAGVSFLAQGGHGTDSVTGLGGYAILGAVFFLISSIRLNILLKRDAAA